MSLSIIIPAYNEERYISQTLESIQKQNFQDYEIIVVCNGCNDKTFEIAKKYTSKVFTLTENNVSKARNFGASQSKNEFLVFLDADVVLEQDVLQQINITLSNSKCFGVTKGKGQGFKNGIYMHIKNFTNKFVPWCHGCVFCPREDFMEKGRFDESLIRLEWRDLFKKDKIKI